MYIYIYIYMIVDMDIEKMKKTISKAPAKKLASM